MNTERKKMLTALRQRCLDDMADALCSYGGPMRIGRNTYSVEDDHVIMRAEGYEDVDLGSPDVPAEDLAMIADMVVDAAECFAEGNSRYTVLWNTGTMDS